MTLTETVKARARELGFEKVGIAPVETLDRAEFYRTWLESEFHGEMEYMASVPDRRADPKLLLPGARFVIVVAKNYHTSSMSSEDPSHGRISRYAWGGDYHDILKAKLHQLRDFLEANGARARACVDTSAILEKLWAQKAGIGWQGKHTNLLARDLGSWFFLGEVVTDAALEKDPAHSRNYCGRCTRCIDVCPTRAIVAPYVLDARKCISYLTIEHRSPIPREIRPLMGNWVFGCDLCLDVCPWNKYARLASDSEFRPREGLDAPRLVELLGMTREEFNRRFKGSPIKRAKYAGFLRNVCVALGNSGDRSAGPALEKALEHVEPLVRGHAAWALGRLGGREALRRRLALETDREVRDEIKEALA